MTEPTAESFRFVIDGTNQQYDAFLYLHPDDYIECRYKPINDPIAKWTFLTAPNVYTFNMTDTAKTDSALDVAIEKINTEIASVFGVAAPEAPTKGADRIKWMIQAGLSETGNVIKRK